YRRNLPAFPTRRSSDLEDNRRYAAVAVIGRTVANNLYSDRDPLGEYMLIGNVPFLIIGVMQEKGATPWGQDQDDVVFVPLNTARSEEHTSELQSRENLV